MQIATGQSMAGMKIRSIPEIPASNDCMIKLNILISRLNVFKSTVS